MNRQKRMLPNVLTPILSCERWQRVKYEENCEKCEAKIMKMNASSTHAKTSERFYKIPNCLSESRIFKFPRVFVLCSQRIILQKYHSSHKPSMKARTASMRAQYLSVFVCSKVLQSYCLFYKSIYEGSSYFSNRSSSAIECL